MSDLSVLEHATDTTPAVSHGDGDHDRFAHYVSKSQLDAVFLTGAPAVAICGKVWKPGKDPKRYPVCPTCKDLYEHMQAGDPENPDYEGGR